METIQYQVNGQWSEVSLEGIVAGLQFRYELGTHGESKLTIPFPEMPPEMQQAIPFEAPCIFWTGRTAIGIGGSILIQGRRTDNTGHAGPDSASQEIVIEDAWYDLRFITLMCEWSQITGYSGTTPQTAIFTWPDCVLMQENLFGPLQPNGTHGVYNPPPVNYHITTGQALFEILAYAIFIGKVNLQIGQIDPACYVPFYPIRAMRIADAIKMCLRVHPDCTCEIDQTTVPPTFNIRRQANLTPVTLPYKSSAGNRTHLTSKVKPLPQLIPSRVAIYYKISTTINGQPVISWGQDIYPNGTPPGLRGLDVSTDMSGPKLAKTAASLTTASFNPTDLDWWTAKVPALKPVADGGQIPNSGDGALTLLDSTINGGLSGHPKGVQVVDDSGNPIDIADTYVCELLTGQPASWMQLAGGGAVQVIEANVVAFFTYHKLTTSGGTDIIDQVGEHMHTVRVKLTNVPAPGNTFFLTQTLATGEVYPTGLAQLIFNSLKTLQYDFTHTVLEQPFTTLIKPGKHCLNLVGGAIAWETMNAMVQGADYDFVSTGAGLCVSKTTVKCGPVAHLEAGELIQIFNMFTNRDLSKINPLERISGQDMSGGNVTLGDDGPKENSVPATSVPALVNVAGLDVESGNTIVQRHDATTATIYVDQNDPTSGSNLTTGIIAPCYQAAGAPGPSTLA